MGVDTGELVAELRALGREALQEATDEIKSRLEERCPVSDDGDDHMVNHIEATEVVDEGDSFSSTITVAKEYASFTDEGTDAHEIHGQPWLVFEGNDGLVFLNDNHGNFVNHPGTQGTNWWSDTMDEWPEIIEAAGG